MGKVIEYKDVELHRQDLIALKHVNLSVDEGEFVYLMGKVGSGKSSLLKSIYADIPIASGEARVLDYDLNKIRNKQIPYLRREIGIVFQDFQLLTDRSAYANLRFVLEATGWHDKAEIEKRIEEVLKQVGMFNKSYKNPHELSGGEQQRIVIARALLNSPRIILADEPTGNLDSRMGAEVMELLHRLNKEDGRTIVMVTHNEEQAKQTSRTIRFFDGRQVQ